MVSNYDRWSSRARRGDRQVIGKSFPREEVPDVIEKLIHVYIKTRESSDENFAEVVGRVGLDPFKEEVYGVH